MITEAFIERAKNCIVEINTDVIANGDRVKRITTDDVYEVWNFNGEESITNIAFLSTKLNDGMYYRATITDPLIRSSQLSIVINNPLQIRIDQFEKISNVCIHCLESFANTIETSLFMDNCITAIKHYIYGCGGDYDDIGVYCLCHAKVLHHHKAIFTLSKSVNGDTLLFEISYNGLTRERYIDVYKKCDRSYIF